MLWNSHYEYFPEFDRLLNNTEKCCSLERLFVEDGLLQELQNNESLQKFLAKKSQIEKLISYAFAGTGQDSCKSIDVDISDNEEVQICRKITRATATHLSIEVLTSDSWPITQAILSNSEFLELILKAPLSNPASLECKVTERLAKVIGHLLTRGPVELGAYVRREWEHIQNFLLSCLSDAYISELLLRLWAASCPHPEKDSQCFAEALVAHLNPASNSELIREAVCHLLVDVVTLPLASDSTQHSAAHIVSTLMSPNLTNQLVDYLIDSAHLQTAASQLLSLLITLLRWPANHGFQGFSTTYKNFVIILIGRVHEIQAVVDPSTLTAVETSTGVFTPLGPLRFEISELWAQLLKVAASSPNESLPSDLSLLELDSVDSVTNTICHSLLDLDVIGWFIDLLAEYPWHNMFHNVAYDFFHVLLSWGSPPSSARPLLLTLFTAHRLVAMLAEGHRKGSHSVGYIGHFVKIGADLKHFIDSLKPTDPMYEPIHEAVRSQGWQEYLQDCLLPAQKRANFGDVDESSMFGEWRLKSIRAHENYFDEDDDIDDLDALKQYSLEDTFEFDADILYEDDDDDEDDKVHLYGFFG
ncbi:sporulation-induced protein, variant 2 [Entomophthora muscae]|uniref:Sporulation-induced protein, variant 2 n=1 Tax=Entomophthora muscae TaxID=34485 RepID=A0ACC2U331_9FUNG|nr:sporulation-induced protein, variant 2 [Entomophthora muscae]